ncbi:MAG: hypothetical protein M1819_002460 [Sarea resinae]|nr:MAG: hypothetical protein M1819_002460 [Sarea resinae]
MAPPDKSGRVVFIGNIPYGLTEEQIIHTFSSVGQVLSFRLVYDKDTGRPKGFGFAEFSDADAAASAVRNLNDYEIMNRKLRVDFSHEGGDDDAAPAGYNPLPPPPQQLPNGALGAQQQQQQQQQPQTSPLPPLPPGIDLPPNLSCPDAISRTLSTLPAPQLLDILSQMKGLVMRDPAKATELLTQAPQLSYAIFQALLLMGLVDTTALASVVEQSAQQLAPPPQQSTPQPLQQAFPPPSMPAYQTAQQQQQQQAFQPQYQQPIPTPPVQATPYQPPPPPGVPMDQKALIAQVLAMTQDQIDVLPPAERMQIMQLRQQLMTNPAFRM